MVIRLGNGLYWSFCMFHTRSSSGGTVPLNSRANQNWFLFPKPRHEGEQMKGKD